jgi:hypothetical protein
MNDSANLRDFGMDNYKIAIQNNIRNVGILAFLAIGLLSAVMLR